MASPRLTSPRSIAEDTAERIRSQGADVKGMGFQALLLGALLLTLLVLMVLIYDQFAKGGSVLVDRGTDFLSGTLRSLADDPQQGVSQGLRGSFWIAVITAVIAFPTGIAAAIYLEEYAKTTPLTRFVELNIRNLAGVPSVVYGLLGLTIFVQATWMEWLTGGRTLLAGGLTLAVLVLPIVIITSAEAIRAVPRELREAGFGVGATQWEVIRVHVLPYAAPGILTGTLLSLSRAVGEAAPLIVVGALTGRIAADTGVFDLGQLQESFTAMPIVITEWASEADPDFRPLTAAAIIVLLAFVVLMNAAAILLRNYFEAKRG